MNDTATITPPTPPTPPPDCTYCAPWACCCNAQIAVQDHLMDPLDDAFAALAPGTGR